MQALILSIICWQNKSDLPKSLELLDEALTSLEAILR
jgi:hypothetical protein